MRRFMTGVALALVAIGCGNSEPASKPKGHAWTFEAFEQPMPEHWHPLTRADDELPVLSDGSGRCDRFAVTMRTNWNTHGNRALHGDEAVWGLDVRPEVWMSPGGFMAERGRHYFQCDFGPKRVWDVGDFYFNCSGALYLKREPYDSGWIQPEWEERTTTLTWSFYDEDKQHLADFTYEYDVYPFHRGEHYERDDQCYYLDFYRTVGGGLSYSSS